MNPTKMKKLEEEALGDLSGRDRVKMILEAGANGDRETIRRLMDTCPRATYRMREADFSENLDGARRLANAGMSIWSQARHALQMVETFQGEEKRIGTTKPGTKAEAIKIGRAALLREQREAILGGFRSAWAGFDTFCRETYDLPAEILIAGIPLADDYTLPAADLDLLAKMTREGEADKDLADYWLETLRAGFTGEGKQ